MSDANTQLQTVIDSTDDVISAFGTSRQRNEEATAVAERAKDETRASAMATDQAGNGMDDVLDSIAGLRQSVGTETPQVLFSLADSVVEYVREALESYRAAEDELEQALVRLKSAHEATERATQQAHKLNEEARDYLGRLQ